MSTASRNATPNEQLRQLQPFPFQTQQMGTTRTAAGTPTISSSSSGSGLFASPPSNSTTPAFLTPSSSSSLSTHLLPSLSTLSLTSLTPAELVFKSRLALQTERYEEVAYFMRVLVLQKSTPLSSDERALFALGYKKLLGTRRMGWRYIYSIEMKEKASLRKLEAEIARETDREAKEQAAAAAAKLKDELQKSEAEKTKDDEKGQPEPPSNEDLVKPTPKSSPTSASTAASPSVLPTLQTRLATLTTNLQHIRSYRYQLFYESSLLISEVSSLLIERLLPKLLSCTNSNEEIFLRFIPAIIDQVISWEKKRTRSKTQQPPPQPTPAKNPPNAATTDKTNPDPASSTPALSSVAGSTSSSTQSLPSPAMAPELTKLDLSRHWSFEVEFELQLRALDERTRFLANLRTQHAESFVFYCKMLGDYRRLLAEFLAERDYEEQQRVTQSLEALAYYTLARFAAQTTLSPAHPIRLGLHLNLSIFYYELLAKPDRACQIASQTYDLALAEWQQRQQQQANATTTNSTANNSHTNNTNSTNSSGNAIQVDGSSASSTAIASTYTKDSLLIMQLLKNNLTLWSQSL